MSIELEEGTSAHVRIANTQKFIEVLDSLDGMVFALVQVVLEKDKGLDVEQLQNVGEEVLTLLRQRTQKPIMGLAALLPLVSYIWQSSVRMDFARALERITESG